MDKSTTTREKKTEGTTPAETARKDGAPCEEAPVYGAFRRAVTGSVKPNDTSKGNANNPQADVGDDKSSDNESNGPHDNDKGVAEAKKPKKGVGRKPQTAEEKWEFLKHFIDHR